VLEEQGGNAEAEKNKSVETIAHLDALIFLSSGA
jgi:hypothetical protein